MSLLEELSASSQGSEQLDRLANPSSVANALGPFVDCTSNQAIALSELSKTGAGGSLVHEQLIQDSIRDAHWMLAQQSGATLEELAVDFAMVRLALAIMPNLTGYSHIQTNPRYSYDTQKTIKNAESTLRPAHNHS